MQEGYVSWDSFRDSGSKTANSIELGTIDIHSTEIPSGSFNRAAIVRHGTIVFFGLKSYGSTNATNGR